MPAYQVNFQLSYRMIRAGDPVITKADLQNAREARKQYAIKNAVLDIAEEVVDAAGRGESSYIYKCDPFGDGTWKRNVHGSDYYSPTEDEVMTALRAKFPDCVVTCSSAESFPVLIYIAWV